MKKKKKYLNGERRKLDELPSSANKHFWGKDAEVLNFDIDKDAQHFKPNVGHEWRQQGPFLICNSCPLKHAVGIGINKRLVGFDKEGKPIVKKFKI